MKRSALPLVRGVYGRVAKWRAPSACSTPRKARERYAQAPWLRSPARPSSTSWEGVEETVWLGATDHLRSRWTLRSPTWRSGFGATRAPSGSGSNPGRLEGYKLFGREWRVPLAAVAAFPDQQRHGRERRNSPARGAPSLADWRTGTDRKSTR